jgi:hypothetical protein
MGSTYVYDKKIIFIYYGKDDKFRVEVREGFREQQIVYQSFVDGTFFFTVSRVREMDGTPTRRIIWQIYKESMIF